jgi:hypothetical protein
MTQLLCIWQLRTALKSLVFIVHGIYRANGFWAGGRCILFPPTNLFRLSPRRGSGMPTQPDLHDGHDPMEIFAAIEDKLKTPQNFGVSLSA